MYILELITKFFKEKKHNSYRKNPQEETDYEECKHIFQPLDSTGETLACTKCGFIIKNNTQNYKPKNPFN